MDQLAPQNIPTMVGEVTCLITPEGVLYYICESTVPYVADPKAMAELLRSTSRAYDVTASKLGSRGQRLPFGTRVASRRNDPLSMLV